MSSHLHSSHIAPHASRLQAVTFDVGGTLIEPWPSVGHIYAAVAARHGLREVSVDSLNRQFAAAWKNLTAFNYTRSEWFGLVNQSFVGLAQTPLTDALFSDLYGQFERPDAWRIFDDVVPTLEYIKSRGLKLGIISNWDERLRPLLRGLKLDRYFNTIVVSCEAGVCKPSSTIFKQAAELLACQPADMLHIGDNPAFDFDAGTSAGLQAFLLARDTTKRPGQLSNLVQLHELIR